MHNPMQGDMPGAKAGAGARGGGRQGEGMAKLGMTRSLEHVATHTKGLGDEPVIRRTNQENS